MSTAATAVPAPEETPGAVNPFARVVGVLFNPKPTFASIIRKPDWILPIILGSLIFIAVTATFTYRGGWPSMFEKQDADNSRIQQMSPAARQKLMDNQMKYAPTFSYVAGAIVPLLTALIVAGILLGAFTATGTTKTNFKTSLAITAYAGMPWIIHGLFSILILFLKDPSTVDLQNVVASNPGAFLSSDAPKWLAALLAAVDVFAVWNLILLGVGFSATNPKKLSVGKAFVIVLALWLFYVAVKVGAIALLT